MNTVKKILVSFMALCLLLSNIPVYTLTAADVTSENERGIESPIASITCKTVEIIEGTNRDWVEEYAGGIYSAYYSYDIQPMFDVTFKDGTELTNQKYSIEYEGTEYPLVCYSDQSYENQWGVGKHTATAELMGVEVEYSVKILETPVQSIVCKDVTIVEGTSKICVEEYDIKTDTYYEFYQYDLSPDWKVIFKDGTEVKGEYHELQYNDQWYFLECTSDQSRTNQWGVGTHTATASFMGVETTFNVNIVEQGESERPDETVEPTETVWDAFKIDVSTADKMIAGNDVALHVIVKNQTGHDLTVLNWFNHWYYQESDNSETYPGIEFGVLTDSEGNVVPHSKAVDMSFAKDESKEFTLEGTLPETWGEKSTITFVIASQIGTIRYCGQSDFSTSITEHIWESTYSTDATGHWIQCSECGEKSVVENHTGGTATCQDKAKCFVCGQAYGEYADNNHVGGTQLKGVVQATCTIEGYTGNTHCRGCGEKLSNGAKVGKLLHDVNEWKVTKEATAETEGEKTGKCTGCLGTFTIKTGKLVSELKDKKVEGNLEAKVESVGDTKFPGETIFVADDVTTSMETKEQEKIDKALHTATTMVEEVTEKHKVASILDLKMIIREFIEETGKPEQLKETEYEPEGFVTVTVEIPEKVVKLYENIVLLHVKDDGIVEKVPFSYVDGYKARFQTNSFSYYVFVGTEKGIVNSNTTVDNTTTAISPNAELPKTGDTNNLIAWGIIIMVACASGVMVVIDKKRYNK